MNENIFLIGILEDRKDIIGNLLAKRLKRQFINISHNVELIEEKNQLDQFQKKYDNFIKIYQQNLRDYSNKSNLVISCGNMIILNNEMIHNISKNSILIFLDSNIDSFVKFNYEKLINCNKVKNENTIEEILAEQNKNYSINSIEKIKVQNKSNEVIVIEILESLEEYNIKEYIDDEEFDETFSEIGKILPSINIEEELVSKKICKLCGDIYKSGKLKNCSICNITVCKKCLSNSFCLNCWVNLSADKRKNFHLRRLFLLFIPIFILFLILKLDYRLFRRIGYLSIAFIFGSEGLTKAEIKKNPEKYLKKEWYNVIQSENYKEICNENSPQRYILEKIYEDIDDQKKKSISKMKRWIDPLNDMKNIQKPYYITKEDIDHQNIELINEDKEPLFTKINIMQDYPDISYNLINKKCKKCKNIIKFADFCPECNIKICPNCLLENNPYSSSCVCGFKFNPLEYEFIKWSKNNEVEFQDKK